MPDAGDRTSAQPPRRPAGASGSWPRSPAPRGRRARSVPIGELRSHLRALPKDADVVAYCRGPYRVYADDAVRELNRRGFRARRLIDGFPDWKRAGLPVAAGEGA